MPALDKTPTRRNYMDICKVLVRIRQGHELLEQKRQILIVELMAYVESAKRIKEAVDQTMAAAYEALLRAVTQAGLTGLMRQSAGITMTHSLVLRQRSVMGVPVPELEVKTEPFGLQFALTESNSPSDEVMRCFLEALQLITRLAVVENAVLRLAREIRRTQRRVRALEKVYIPEYNKVLRQIGEALAERDREAFVVLRKVKHRRRQAMLQQLVD